VFLDVKPLHQKPPRNPAWIAALLLIALSLGVFGFFKLRSGKTTPDPVDVQIVDEEPFPPVVPTEPVTSGSAEEQATYSLSPVAESESEATPPPAASGPPKLDLPTMRSSSTGSIPAPTSAPDIDVSSSVVSTPATTGAAATPASTVMSAPRVPGMLTARLSGEGATAAPNLETSINSPASPASALTASSNTPESTPSATPAPTTTETARNAVRLPSRPVRDTFEAQLALDQMGFSAGSIDGVYGNQTRLALLAFQQKERLSMTGRLDAETMSRLRLIGEPHRYHVLTESELSGLTRVPESWSDRSRQGRLGFESVLELIAEKSHASPAFIRRLNPGINWTSVAAGSRIRVPNAVRETPKERAAFLRIRLGEQTVQAFDQQYRIIAHYPCSIAANFANRPQGELKVTVLVEEPNYTFDPKRFPNTPEAKFLVNKLIIPPGPNNPVGAAWVGLDKPGYGIHGTPDPEKIGRTGSLGCFRLANWNAKHLVKLSWIGMPVYVVR